MMTAQQNDQAAEQVRQYLDRALLLMREMRGTDRSERSRRLSQSITTLEDACMWFNMSQFHTDKDYTPILGGSNVSR